MLFIALLRVALLLLCVTLQVLYAASAADPWAELGAGCCSGQRTAAAGKLYGGNQASLDACKNKCLTFDDCGFVEYGWYKSSWCFVWSSSQQCSTLDSRVHACGTSGKNGVRTYKFDKSKMCGLGIYNTISNSCSCGQTGYSGFTCEMKGICRFSPSYTWNPAILTDVAVQDEYLKNMLRWDGVFATPGFAVRPSSYLTTDNVVIAGNGAPQVKAFYTAASKESLNIGMLAVIVGQLHKLAWHWIADAPDEAAAVAEAKVRLQGIITTYENFNKANPGLGGFIPWIDVSSRGFHLKRTKNVNLPGLDNGQLAWAFVAAAEALTLAGETALAKRYTDYVTILVDSAPTIFIRSDGRVHMVVKVANSMAPVSTDNIAGGSGYLGDPYEGELMLMFLDLMCHWDDASRKEIMWSSVKAHQKAVEYTHWALPDGPITVQKGWRFSAHELWKYLVLPYTDNELVANIFANGERVRTWHSRLNGIPGLMGSCYGSDGKYYDVFGIKSVAGGYREPSKDKLMVTPYGAFPLMLADLGYGLAWHQSMLSRPHMQNVLGATEASQAFNGTAVAMKTSWDTKVTANLAAVGGTLGLLRRVIHRKAERKARWEHLLDKLHEPYYPKPLKGESTPFATPMEYRGGGDFGNCVRLSRPLSPTLPAVFF